MKLTALTGAAIGKGNFRHFMEKELHEHPAVIGDTLHRMVDRGTRAVPCPPCPSTSPRCQRITMSACGCAFYAGLTAKFWLENLARMPMDADVASEFRYRTPPLEAGGLGLLVSQSGETADTLAALRYMQASRAQHVLSVLNVPESSMARESRTRCWRPSPGRRSASPAPRPSPRSSPCWPCLALALAAGARAMLAQAEEAAMTAALLEVPGQGGGDAG